MTAIESASHRAPSRGALARFADRLAALLLWLLAGFGTVCIAMTVAAFVFGLHLTMFSTGSMAPKIPQGAVALTRNTPASKLRVGDIATVRRTNELPITHRIVSITAVPGAPDQRRIIMKGDANQAADATPYVISQAGKVLWSVPGGASWIVRIDSRRTLGAASVAAALVVIWVFWPRRTESDRS